MKQSFRERLLDFDSVDELLLNIPIVKNIYSKNAAKIKRSFYIKLHRYGLLKPYAFIIWLITNKCNYKCPFCEASSGISSNNELDTNEAKIVIDDMHKTGVKRILFTGGEALLRQDILELMEYANYNKIQLGLLSNGLLAVEKFESLKKLKFFMYFTSIDGIKEHHDKMRGVHNAFDNAFLSLELFEKIGVPIRMINTVISPQNINDLDNLFNQIKKSAANRWHLTPIAQVGRAKNEKKYSLSSEELHYLMDFVKRQRMHFKIDIAEAYSYLGCFDNGPVGKPFFCGAGLTRASIMPNGDVIACNQIYDSSKIEGNVRNKSFSKIWQEDFQRFRSDHLYNSCMNCEYIAGCQGGCWAEMENQGECLKRTWSNDQ